MRTLTIATRGSRLALIQAEMIRSALRAKGAEAEFRIVSTKGDRDRVSPITAIGGRGLFVTEIERVLLDGEADIAVHSGKDLPYRLQSGLIIAGVPQAAAPNDCLIRNKGNEDLRIIGTGSPRRMLECGKFYPDAAYRSIRGNVDTRLGKLRQGECDGILLAKAGLDRLGADLSEFDVRVFTPEEFIPSACQGILAAECREDDKETVSLLRSVSHEPSFRRFTAERTMLSLLEADCSAAIGAYSEVDGERVRVTGFFEGRRSRKEGDYAEVQTLCEAIRHEIIG